MLNVQDEPPSTGSNKRLAGGIHIGLSGALGGDGKVFGSLLREAIAVIEHLGVFLVHEGSEAATVPRDLVRFFFPFWGELVVVPSIS